MSFDVSQESAFAPEQDFAPLWTPLGLFAPMHARLSGVMPQPIFGVSIDTRTLMPGDLFFAIKGDRSDGHDHVRDAFEKGAAALRKQIQTLSDISSKTPEQSEDLEEKQHKLGGVLCAVAEVYMTDLSWEADAEQRCEALITEAERIGLPGFEDELEIRLLQQIYLIVLGHISEEARLR